MYGTRYSCRISNKLEFYAHNFEKKNTQISNFMKIRPVGAKLFHVGRLTNRQAAIRNLTVAFRNFANAPEMTQEIYTSNTFKSPDIFNSN